MPALKGRNQYAMNQLLVKRIANNDNRQNITDKTY
jgi:hypothetical protein